MPDQPAQRFDHYELVTGEDGKPVELGRGAMGVTYKAFDINLRCPVTLKVISEYIRNCICAVDVRSSSNGRLREVEAQTTMKRYLLLTIFVIFSHLIVGSSLAQNSAPTGLHSAMFSSSQDKATWLAQMR
jgi:hypothetical protein